MIRFYQERFVEAFTLLRQIESELRSILSGSKRKRSEFFPKAAHIQRAKLALGLIGEQCRLTELKTPRRLAAKIVHELHADSKFFDPPSVKEMLAQVELLKTAMKNELSERLFMYVPVAKAGYWQISGPFPRSFLPPDLKNVEWEIDEAGNCYAAGRNTACVFHLMRAAEIGLRMLSKHLNVVPKRPIDFEDWRPVLEGIEKKLKLLENEARGPERADTIEFYSDLASHLRHFKNMWRDNTAHARKRYNEHEALAAITRVNEFMILLTNRLAL